MRDLHKELVEAAYKVGYDISNETPSCPSCKVNKCLTFINHKNKINACICGYREKEHVVKSEDIFNLLGL
jgi:hypothetical protein